VGLSQLLPQLPTLGGGGDIHPFHPKIGKRLSGVGRVQDRGQEDRLFGGAASRLLNHSMTK